MWILETERLMLRKMHPGDMDALAQILMDEETMYAYEGAFTWEETEKWLQNQLRRYREMGRGLWAVILKETGEMIGQCGLTKQPIPDGMVDEVGYLFNRAHWKKGYAMEAARACRDYGFEMLGMDMIYSIIRDTNIASQNVARRNGMQVVGQFIKHYRGADMPHLLYAIQRSDWMGAEKSLVRAIQTGEKRV